MLSLCFPYPHTSLAPSTLYQTSIQLFTFREIIVPWRCFRTNQGRHGEFIRLGASYSSPIAEGANQSRLGLQTTPSVARPPEVAVGGRTGGTVIVAYVFLHDISVPPSIGPYSSNVLCESAAVGIRLPVRTDLTFFQPTLWHLSFRYVIDNADRRGP